METIGHADVRERFERTLSRNRLASTYLFVGPAGVGKRTFALELAAALLCSSRGARSTRLSQCGSCESCRLFRQAAHPDLLQVAKPPDKATLPIDLFLGRAEHRNREGLCHEIALKPFLAGRRIAIIDDADYLSPESANCLLKTLEEPPPRSVLILIGTSLSKQLPTIRSRSQIVRFQPLRDAEVAQILADKELLPDVEGEGQQAESLAAVSAGSVSRALAACDSALAPFQLQLERILADPNFDPIRLAAEVTAQANAAGEDASSRRDGLRTIIGFAIDFHREQLRQAASAADRQALATRDVLLTRMEHSLSAAEAIDRNANLATVTQHWLVGLSSN